MTLILLNITLSLIFLTLTHPLSLGLVLLIQTTIISMISGMFSYNFWFSYILFLIMIGGMLILFIYMTSIASNEKFSFNIKTMWLVLMMPIAITIPVNMMFFTDSVIWNSMTSNSIVEISMIKYTFIPMNMLLMFMIMYLFITMIAIVKIIDKSNGPLRQKN
uniref:NADH dehydrogenase subunit 6 n=1 Tax=Gnathium nitidum TaxID=2914702 RepID=UPI001FA76C1D|nr:NADH dehydrogenase subunit 6 [Gnathium nitidum]UMR54870.1 NADH dehydrogenase subunit 6 [Gnathium nitidum]